MPVTHGRFFWRSREGVDTSVDAARTNACATSGAGADAAGYDRFYFPGRLTDQQVAVFVQTRGHACNAAFVQRHFDCFTGHVAGTRLELLEDRALATVTQQGCVGQRFRYYSFLEGFLLILFACLNAERGGDLAQIIRKD